MAWRLGRFWMLSIILLSGVCLVSSGCVVHENFGSVVSSREMPGPGGGYTNWVPASSHVIYADQEFMPLPAFQSGEEVDWSIITSQPEPGMVNRGRSLIGPDGSMVIGPYGSYRVGGLTVDQARLTLQKELAPYIKDPQVFLQSNGRAIRQVVGTVPVREIQMKSSKPALNNPKR